MSLSPPREDVLDAFAMEATHDRATLERYLRDYPEHAVAIVDLSRELARDVQEHDAPLSAQEQEMIEAAWQRHAAAAPKAGSDPFATLAVAQQRELARQLHVPRQVISAIRDRRALAESIPRGLLRKLAAAANQSVDAITNALAMSSPAMARSHKSDVKPGSQEKVTFEQLLIEAGVPASKRAELMADD